MKPTLSAKLSFQLHPAEGRQTKRGLLQDSGQAEASASQSPLSRGECLSLFWRAEDYEVKGWLAPPSEGEGLIPSTGCMLPVCGVSWLVDVLQGLRLPSQAQCDPVTAILGQNLTVLGAMSQALPSPELN